MIDFRFQSCTHRSFRPVLIIRLTKTIFYFFTITKLINVTKDFILHFFFWPTEYVQTYTYPGLFVDYIYSWILRFNYILFFFRIDLIMSLAVSLYVSIYKTDHFALCIYLINDYVLEII